MACKVISLLNFVFVFKNILVGAFTIKDEYNYLNQLTNKALQRTEITDKEKVALYNVLASLEYSMKNDLQALEYQKKTLELMPDEPAYQYNAATIYKVLNKEDELMDSVNKLIDIYKNKDPQTEVNNLGYLQYARNILLNSDQADKVSLIDDIISNAKNYPKNKY